MTKFVWARNEDDVATILYFNAEYLCDTEDSAKIIRFTEGNPDRWPYKDTLLYKVEITAL